MSRVETPPARAQSHEGEISGARRWKKFGVAFVLLLLPMLLWALASPLGSVPDEPSHAIRAAAVVRGQIVTPPWKGNPALAQSVVPRYVANMHDLTCYVGKPRVTPACEVPLSGNIDALVTTGNSASNNSPAYYAIIGLPTLVLDGDAALYAMRFLNSILSALALAAMFMQLTLLARSRWAIVGAVIAVTPMVLFLSGSINPNAIEVASAGALFVTLVAIVRSPSSARILWERVAIAVVSVGLLVNSRSISLLWIVLIIAAVLMVTNFASLRALLRRPATWALLAGSAAMIIAALAWYANPPHYNGGPVAGVATSSFTAFISMVVRTFEFASGYVGYFGWLDTPSPALSVILWSVFIVGIFVGALIWGSGRARWVAAGFGAAMLVVPPVVQALLAPSLGYIWQGRYMLAALICLLAASGMALDNAFEERPLAPRLKTAIVTGVALFAVGQIVSFVWTLRRYTVGSHGSIVSMITNPAWQPPGGWIILTTIFAAWGIAFIFVLRRQIAASNGK